MAISTETLDAACERIAKLEDLARNIAGFDDGLLVSADLHVMREWRKQARELME